MVWYRLRVLGSVSTHMSQQKCRVHVYTCNAPFPWVFTWSPNMHCMFRQWKYYESKKKPWFLQFSSVNKSKAFQDMLNTWYNNKIFFYCRAKGLGPKIRTQKNCFRNQFFRHNKCHNKGNLFTWKTGAHCSLTHCIENSDLHWSVKIFYVFTAEHYFFEHK